MTSLADKDLLEETESRYGRIAFFKNDLYLGRSLREYGEWAQAELEFLETLIEKDSTVVDAGAYIGTHALAFSRFVGKNGRVYAFEPHPTYFQVLKRNLLLNNAENVHALNAGLSDRAVEMQLENLDLSQSNSFGSVSLDRGDTDSVKNDTVDVQLMTLDHFDLDACHLIKVDVEGMESRVLLGGSSTIERHQPIIYAECNSADSGWPVVMMMRSLNYCVYLYSVEAYNPRNFRGNSLNIFDRARELALLCVPSEKKDSFRSRLSPKLDVVQIDRLDDLVLCLIKKPQYKQEVLLNCSGVKTWGNDFWKNEGELAAMFAEHENQIADLNRALAQRDCQIGELENAIHSSNVHVHELETEIARRERDVDEILKSNSWRITQPLRSISQKGKRAKLRARRAAALTMRHAYHSLPMSVLRKQQLKSVVFRAFGFALQRTGTFQRWKAYEELRRTEERIESTPPEYRPSDSADTNRVLPNADGVWEWVAYDYVKARIKRVKRARCESYESSAPSMIEIGGEDLLDAALGVKLPSPGANPLVSIIIPVFNHLKLTLECLLSISAHTGLTVSYEVIVSDDASTDATRSVLGRIPNLRVRHNEENLGFLRNCNNALPDACGEYVVFLNNDVQVTEHWLGALIATFTKHDRVGAVGPKILYPNGYLQEAGVTLKSDGTSEMIGLNEDPDLPRYSYTRRVDYCSGACLMLPTKLLRSLGGFSDEFAPSYCEDSDLCMKIQEAGYYVYFNPDSRVISSSLGHHVGGALRFQAQVHRKQLRHALQEVADADRPVELGPVHCVLLAPISPDT